MSAKRVCLCNVLLMTVLLTTVVLLSSSAIACPTCKEGIAQSDPAQANLVRGYFWSIIFMMSMPFLILSSLSLYFYLLVRKARALQPPAAAGALSLS